MTALTSFHVFLAFYEAPHSFLLARREFFYRFLFYFLFHSSIQNCYRSRTSSLCGLVTSLPHYLPGFSAVILVFSPKGYHFKQERQPHLSLFDRKHLGQI